VVNKVVSSIVCLL